MAEKLDPQDFVSVEALALSSAWEVAAKEMLFIVRFGDTVEGKFPARGD